MSLDLNNPIVRQCAQRGLEMRLAEIKQEKRAIFAIFPDLPRVRNTPHSAYDVVHSAGLQDAAEDYSRNVADRSAGKKRPTERPRRKKMSARQRQAVSVRMTKYWAARRKEAAAQTAKHKQ